MVGCEEMSVVNWEKGHNTPGVNHMAQIVAFLGFNPIDAGATIGQRLGN